MKVQKNIYDMTDRELRAYKRRLRRQREIIRKCVLFTMTLGLIIVGAISYHSFSSSANTGKDEMNFKYYTSIIVAHGETLWDIADEYIDYDEYDNKNEYIAEVQNINHLNDKDDIRSGQILIVPYYSNEFIK